MNFGKNLRYDLVALLSRECINLRSSFALFLFMRMKSKTEISRVYAGTTDTV